MSRGSKRDQRRRNKRWPDRDKWANHPKPRTNWELECSVVRSPFKPSQLRRAFYRTIKIDTVRFLRWRETRGQLAPATECEMKLFSILHQKIRIPTEKPDADADQSVHEIPHLELEFSHNEADITEHRLQIKAPDGRIIELTFAKNGQHISTEIHHEESRPVPFEKTHETEAREEREKRAADHKAAQTDAPRAVSASSTQKAPRRNEEGGEQRNPVGEDRNTVERSGA